MPVDFRAQLRRQITFIKNSADRFDYGCHEEAVRIATSLRVIFHDTKASTSLLKHLGAQGVKVVTTIKPCDNPRATFWDPLVFWWGDHRYENPLPAAQWWTREVARMKVSISCRDVVLAAANKDGGAHVDAAPCPKYEALAKSWLGPASSGVGEEPIDVSHLVALRQFAYEVFRSPELLALADRPVQGPSERGASLAMGKPGGISGFTVTPQKT